MNAHQTLGALSHVQRMLVQLVESLPEADANRQFHPALYPPAWYLGRAVYLETYLLRERVSDDADLTRRVRHIFGTGQAAPSQASALLPPRDHLLNWALEIQEENLTRLANPRSLPHHPLLDDDWLPAYLLQAESLLYEDLLLVANARQVASLSTGQVAAALAPAAPRADAVAVAQGHYRIGERAGVLFDSEQPPQAVELHSFRIARQPVSNAEYLGFLLGGGYDDDRWWDPAGRAWRDAGAVRHPFAWRADAAGRWHGVGLNGAYELGADTPVAGVSLHEARAFACWAAAQGGPFAGAVLPHEFQWETAARTGAIAGTGLATEWCANTFMPYDRYAAPDDPELATAAFDGQHLALRGATLHTQPCLRRVSLRRFGQPGDNHRLAGFRLVFPPSAG
jgi:iron(II)-dependent oxidoreductase